MHNSSSVLQTPSNEIERSFYELYYSIQNIGRSTKGRYDMTNPARALVDINAAREKLKNLEKVCRADIRKRTKYAESMGLTVPYNVRVPQPRSALDMVDTVEISVPLVEKTIAA